MSLQVFFTWLYYACVHANVHALLIIIGFHVGAVCVPLFFCSNIFETFVDDLLKHKRWLEFIH